MINSLSLTMVCLMFLRLVGKPRAEDFPTSLICTANAKASRDYGFREQQWSGIIPPNPSKVLGISTPRQKEGGILRDKVFSVLTPNPIIRSITPPRPELDQVQEQAQEFKGIVTRRTSDSLFVVWGNDF